MPDGFNCAMTSQLDQWDAFMTQLGAVAGHYHRSLVDSGISKELAADLLRQWHWLLWHHTYYPRQAPGSEDIA